MEDKASNKALSFLENNGLVQAYEYLLTSLCEHGLPTGDLYEFSALMVLKFEKKWRAKQRLNKAKPGQETSPLRKSENHEQETIKTEDKAHKTKEDKKSKEDQKVKEDSKVKEDKKVKEDPKGKPEEKKSKKEEEKNKKEKEEEKNKKEEKNKPQDLAKVPKKDEEPKKGQKDLKKK